MTSPTTSKYLQEEEICNDFISTLPKEKTFTSGPVYQYQGFWYHDKHLLGLISSQKHFEAQHSDVFLASNPKCGTTWLKSIAFALLNRKRHPVAAMNHPLLTINAHEMNLYSDNKIPLVPYIEMNLYSDNKIPDMETFPSPRLLATHMPYISLPDSIKKSSNCKLVYVSRDPKDAFVSLWHHMSKLGYLDTTCSMEDAFKYFCKGFTIYGLFWDHVLGYWKRSLENPERVLFLKYEDMKAQPALHLRRMAEFLDCPFSADEEECGVVHQILDLCSFDHLSGLQVNKTGISIWGVDNSALFRRGEVGDSKNYLSAEMIDKIDQITRDKFSGSGLVL